MLPASTQAPHDGIHPPRHTFVPDQWQHPGEATIARRQRTGRIGRRAQEHQAGQRVGAGLREGGRHIPTQAVPRQHDRLPGSGRIHGFTDHCDRRLQTEFLIDPPTVPGQVHRDHLDPRQQGRIGPPLPRTHPGAVHQHQSHPLGPALPAFARHDVYANRVTQPSLPPTARETTAASPWPVRTLSMKISDYVDKMSALWVEGQIVQLNQRPGMSMAFVTLRDTEVDMSLSVTIPVRALQAMPSPPQQGARVVVHAQPSFWTKRGTLQLEARQMRHVGVGELLARLEHLKQLLRSEGLFDADRKLALPFLPVTIGLIVGRDTAAERDVLAGVARRWPAARFEIRQVPVQGRDTVPAVTAALAELEALPTVEVIVIARGGGSFEDLLPFSNEALVRAVAACRTPVVSAIGHESDTPLVDFVADVRASTPTHAAARVVPDVADERAGLATVRRRAHRALHQRLDGERSRLQALLSRPVMVDRAAIIAQHRQEVDTVRLRGLEMLSTRLEREHDRTRHLVRHLRAVSPQHTLERGYAVVRHADGRIVRDQAEVDPEELLRVTVSRGDFGVRPVS